MTTFDPAELLADARRKQRRAEEVVSRARAKLGVQTATRREGALDATQRAAADRAMSGPLGWLFVGSSPEDVLADSRTLKKILAIFRRRPDLRGTQRSIIQLRNGRTVKFNPRTGEVIRP
jgi:hypothetical protein